MSTTVYFVPWVKGPNGLSRPFALSTKYGDLVFVFVDQGELYNIFFNQSAAVLPAGLILEHTAVGVVTDEELGPTLANHIPPSARAGIVRQGTDGFEKMIRELADDTIWPEGDAGGIAAWCLIPPDSTRVTGQSSSAEQLRFSDSEQEKRKVFISYVRDDRDRIEKLASALRSARVPVWIDTSELHPGERWRDQIRDAIRDGAFFLAAFSKASESRDRTYMREELAIALEEARLRRRDVPWLVPLLLDNVPLPDYPLGPGERLSDLHAAILYGDWDKGIRSLVEVLRSSLGLDVSTRDIGALVLELANRQAMGQTYSLRIEYPDGTVHFGVPKNLELGRNDARMVVGTSQGDIILDRNVPAVVRVLVG